MLTIRLQRAGKKNKPEFRIVLAQKTAAAGKKFLEVLGNYNPRNKAFSVKNSDRLKYWIEQHVELSPTIRNLFISKEIISGKKVRAFSVPKKPAEPVAEAVAQAPAATEASVEPQPEATPAAEAPASEQPAA